MASTEWHWNIKSANETTYKGGYESKRILIRCKYAPFPQPTHNGYRISVSYGQNQRWRRRKPYLIFVIVRLADYVKDPPDFNFEV